MPAVSILIKPASSACNIDCKYCFYKKLVDEEWASFFSKNHFLAGLSLDGSRLSSGGMWNDRALYDIFCCGGIFRFGALIKNREQTIKETGDK